MIDSVDDIIAMHEDIVNAESYSRLDSRVVGLSISDFDEDDKHTQECVFLDNHTLPPRDTSENVINTLAGNAYMYNKDISMGAYKLDPFAATFTFPVNHVFSKVYNLRYTKTGREIKTAKELYLIDQEQMRQWRYFIELYNRLVSRVQTKHYINIFAWELYPEFTKQGLIHVHGLLWFRSEGWGVGKSHAVASEWARLTKGSMRAYISHNANGTTSYAIAPCKDVEQWRKYSSKEYLNKAKNYLSI